MRNNHIRSLIVAAVAACALALGATSASASVSWATTGSLGLSGSIVIKNSGVNPKTCTIGSTVANAHNEGGYGYLTGSSFPTGIFSLSCTGGTTLQMQAYYNPVFGSPGNYVLTLGLGGSSPIQSPYGLYGHYAEVPFVNGSGSVKSTLVFNNTVIGSGSGYITATGTLNVTNGGTGTRTLTGSW